MKTIDKKTVDLNNSIDQVNLTDIYRTLHTAIEYIRFLRAHGTFARIDHIFGQKTTLVN